MRGDREKLLHMEDALSKRVVGQDPAIKVSRCFFRNRLWHQWTKYNHYLKAVSDAVR
jgi:hypothetical protein